MVGKLLVIGIGNDLREDDGAGRAVAARLLERGVSEDRVLSLVQLLPEHAELFSQAHRIVVVDAARDLPPGEIRREPIVARIESETRSVHSLGVASVVRMAMDVYGQAAPTELISIGGQDWGLGDKLSPSVQIAAERVAEMLLPEVMPNA